ncbi:hypothetical protein BACCIP111895_03933 [Neobacillus rhizosphaerae]|uniref:Glycosyl transferase family 1 domain-containing protein n=1 Tax=Neobacillus rhizosphaerae TaxID=2880965 RepID=A0ABN8KWC6_9BACI|nr:glycosyltransferase [Neobacillus rhizosphaerae]CAH2716745.1 hypothetical protein BACCIP111895_03933 [Neobacillus rhizosphaerae]
MNYIIVETGKTLGGIENFIIETVKKLTSDGNKVFILTKTNTTIYHQELINKSNIEIINLGINKPVEYLLNSDIKKLKDYCYQHITRKMGNGVTTVICPFFDNLQLGLLLFAEDTSYRIFHIWGHPEDWVKTLKIYKNSGFHKRKIKNSKYFYQKSLLSKLFKEDADFYGGRIVPVFNSWYYETELSPEKICTFPIEDIKKPYQEITYTLDGKIKVLWCGRFDEWKNEAIIHISKCLDSISQNTDMDISFDIIGYGSKKNTLYVKNNISSKNIEVNFLSYVSPQDLSGVMKEYHLGIGMGLSVKKMAQVGLPSIVIDSVDNKNIDKLKAEWLFNTFEGDAGDGYYFEMVGQPLNNRHQLMELLSEVINNQHLLEVYSRRSREFVEENYSQDKQIESFISCSNKSLFRGIGQKIYRRNILLRVLFSIYSLLAGKN